MLKFGKRVTYRPLLISLLISLLPGLGFYYVFSSVLIGLMVGLGIFLIIFVGYYWQILPTMFNYWEIDATEIRYSNMESKSKRFLILIAPFAVKKNTLDLDKIASVTITGKLDSYFDIPIAIPYSAYLGILTPIISIIRNPVDLKFVLKDGSSVTLSVARDFIYNKNSVVGKLDKLFEKLSNAGIEINDRTDHVKKFS